MSKRNAFSDPKYLAKALQTADLRVLLMVLFHLTGDRSWLKAPFLPKRDVNLIADQAAGFDPLIQQQIREAAFGLLNDRDPSAKITDPGDKLMVEMMSHCLGETVAPEYAPMMREQLGLIADTTSLKPQNNANHPVLIVGAGISGIAMAQSLQKQNIAFIIIEKNCQVGGTWWNNNYPGCGVDTPNHAYSFSFGQRYPWSRYFAPKAQIQDYIERSAEQSDLQQHIRFNSEVGSAQWIEEKNYWLIEVKSETGTQQIKASALISAIGQFNHASTPNLSGIKQFTGEAFHSTQWPENLDLSNKHVSIIGTGATSMQIVPSIVDQVASLKIYQRSAQWARPIPHYHDEISEEALWLLKVVPFYAQWFRFTMFWRYGDGLLPSLKKDPHWPHPERSLNKANERHRLQMLEHIETELAGREDLIAKCTPNYPPYGKRILLDNGWYQTLLKDNVELISDDIKSIHTDTIETTTGDKRESDVIIFATGFQIGQMAARLNISGTNGQKLSELWADDNPAAYLGITVPGFPNLFCMQGPNTGLGHGGSAIFQSECQANYISNCLVQMREQNCSVFDVTQQAHDDYVASVDKEHEAMIWTHPGMSTYYRNAKGRVVSVMPWRLVDYWHMTRNVDLSHYELS